MVECTFGENFPFTLSKGLTLAMWTEPAAIFMLVFLCDNIFGSKGASEQRERGRERAIIKVAATTFHELPARKGRVWWFINFLFSHLFLIQEIYFCPSPPSMLQSCAKFLKSTKAPGWIQTPRRRVFSEGGPLKLCEADSSHICSSVSVLIKSQYKICMEVFFK